VGAKLTTRTAASGTGTAPVAIRIERRVSTGETPRHECVHDRMLARMEAERDPEQEAALQVRARSFKPLRMHVYTNHHYLATCSRSFHGYRRVTSVPHEQPGVIRVSRFLRCCPLYASPHAAMPAGGNMAAQPALHPEASQGDGAHPCRDP